MKKQFLSKAVPRGTRTIWRYLSALFILFTFAIGNVWGADVTFGYGTSMSTTSGATGTKDSLATITHLTLTKEVGKSGVNKLSDTLSVYSNGNQACYGVSNGNNKPTAQYSKGAYKWNKSRNSFSPNLYVGYKVEIEDGYKLNLSGLTSLMYVSSDFTYKVCILDKNQNELFSTESLTISNYNSKTSVNAQIDSLLSDNANLQNLKDSIFVRAYMYKGSTGKYFFISKLQLTGAVESAGGGGGGGEEPGSDPIKVTSISIDDPADGSEFYVGDVVTFETTVLPENATNKTLNWSLDSPEKGTFTSPGVLTIAEAGDFHVTASATDGSGKSKTIHLYTYTAPQVCPSGLNISGTAAYSEGQTISLSAGLGAGNGDITYNWYKGADFATAKAAGSIGTGKDYSKASCALADAGSYWCEAAKEGCSAAHNGSAFVVSVEAVAQTIFHWRADAGTTTTDAANGTTTGGTVTLRSKDTNTWGTESVTYNASVAADMKATSSHEMKSGKNALYLELALTSGTFQEDDTIYVTGYNTWGFSTSSSFTSWDVDSIVTGATGKGDVKTGYGIIKAGVNAAKIYARRGIGSGSGIAAIKVIRPAARPIASTVITLSDLKVNDHSISADSLAALVADHSLTLGDEFTVAPVIKFNEHKVVTYADSKEPAQKVSDKVYTVTATTVSDNWQAAQEINSVTYTVTAPKVSSAKVYYYNGSSKLGEETVAINGNPADYETYQAKVQLASFVDWYSDPDLAEAHKIADISSLVVTGNVNVYGKWTPIFATSVNIEKWVLDNGAGKGATTKTSALISLLGTNHFASGFVWENKNLELDSLDDSKGTGRNYDYLGLKVKKSGKQLDFWLENGKTVKVKFGHMDANPLVSINGAAYASEELTDGVYTYTATGDDYVSIKTPNANAHVFKQIMINEDIQAVTLPEATRHAVVLSEAGETEHGTLAVASPETYNWLAKDVEVTLTVAADEGYYIESVTLNGEALTPSENVYSFAMPNATANVVATFAEIVPNNVTYKANNGGEDADILVENATEIAGCSFTYAGHKFNGWNTEANGSGDAYSEGDPVLSPLTLYAQWKEYFVITYKDGDDVLDTEDVFVGEAPVGIADPVKAMNIFKGWTLGGSDEVTDVTALDATTTVYAKWEAIDACFYFSAKSVTEDEAITAPANLDNTFGGTLEATDGTFTYTQYGVLIAGGGSKYFTVNLNYALQEGSKITVKMYAGGTSERGLNLRVAGSSSNVYQYKWTPSATEPAQMEYEYEYVVPENSPLIGKKVFYLYRNNNVYLQTVMVKDCAPQDYTVTYKDGETVLGTEQVFENAHPTADGINTHKKGYEFQGWAETVDGTVVDLDDITITAAKNLFAQYTVKDCSPKGVKFSMAIDGSKISANQYYPATTPAVGDLAVFATVTGGVAQAVNTSTGTTKNFEVKTTPEFKLGGSNSHMRILLDCPLAENDTIKFEKTERIILSFDSLKTKSENIAKTTSYYIVPAAYAGEDTIHIWYNSNGVSVNGVQVVRPEICAVSFNLMGHGSAIAPIDVVKGGKITAPTAPEDEDFAFAGWYKENTLSNAWDFDNDVVAANTILYAKWLDMTDATLKSLKYGATDVVLEDGVYEYNVELPALSTSVPALSAETSNPNATKEISNATEFDAEGHATSTVVVTPEKEGAATQTYTVNFSKAASVALQVVTGSITWNFANAVTGTVNITGTPQVLANYAGVTNDNTFESDKLEASGEKFTAGSNANLRANYIRFHTTVPGKLSISYSNTGGSNPARYIYVNGVKYDEEGSASTTKKGLDTKVFVPAGDVVLVMKDGEDVSKNVQIYQMIFNATPDYEREVSNNIGTLCVEHNVPAGQYLGATFYQIASRNALYNDKIDFEEVLPNEELKAGEPYIFQSTTGKIELFFGEETAANPIPVRGMIGNYAAGHLNITDDNKLDILYIAKNKLWNCEDLVESGLKLNDHRAYIKMSEVWTYEDYEASKNQQNAAPRRRVTIGGDAPAVTTGIENGGLINGENGVQKVLINGQIFILRGEKMYDATGRLVK